MTNLTHRDGAVGAIVLGASRSGTSAVTRTLVGCGFYAGPDSELMEPNAGNPGGYWENMAVVALNEDILERAGGTWFAPPTAQAQLAIRPWAEPQLRSLLERLLLAGGSAPLVVKDPRIGGLLELWAPVIEGSLHPVLSVRNPVEIALSLASRDGTPTAFGLAGWELHIARLLEYLRGRAVTVVPYAQLLQSPTTATRFVADVAARLSPERAERVNPDAAPDTIQPGLHREHASPADLADHLTRRQAELWDFLEHLPPGNQVLDVPSELTRPNPAAAALAAWESQRAREQRSFEEQRARLAGQTARLAEQSAELAAQQHRADIAEFWLGELQESASWRLTAPLRLIMRAVRHTRAPATPSAPGKIGHRTPQG